MATLIGALMSPPSAFSLPRRRKPANMLPGFELALGSPLLHLALIALAPLPAAILKMFTMTWDVFWTTVTVSRVVTSYKLTFGASLIATVINLVFGLIVAWVLVRHHFSDKRLIDALAGLPSALSIAVVGVALTTLYAPSDWIGLWPEPLGLKVAFALLGIVVVLTFIGLPFVMYTVQPVLEDLEAELEEAAASLDATRWQAFIHVTLPTLLPALLTGFTPVFVRAMDEYGPVILIASNMPMVSEIVLLMIYSKLEQFGYVGATVIAIVMLGISFTLLLVINLLQAQTRRRGNRNDTIKRAPEPSTTHTAAGV